MSWKLVRLADVSPMPWRNGGGVTRELVAWPEQGDWAWRMSVAEVDTSGPFSTFPGVTRWFAVLQGAGVQLQIDGVRRSVRGSDEPLVFDGNAATDCSLLDGSTQDFNLMVRTAHGSSSMQRIHGLFGVRLNAPKIIAVYAIDTGACVQFEHENLAIDAGTLAWRRIPANTTVRVESVNALWMEIAV